MIWFFIHDRGWISSLWTLDVMLAIVPSPFLYQHITFVSERQLRLRCSPACWWPRARHPVLDWLRTSFGVYQTKLDVVTPNRGDFSLLWPVSDISWYKWPINWSNVYLCRECAYVGKHSIGFYKKYTKLLLQLKRKTPHQYFVSCLQ